MDLHQHLPEHAYHWIEDETHQSSTWSSAIGIWCVSNRTDLGKWYISGPRGVRAELPSDTAETQVIALLRLLGAIDPAPRRTVATEELITDLQQHLDDNHDPYSGPLTSHDAARIMISWLQQAGDGQAMARILTERARDQKAVRDRLSATHSPETHELDLRHSENSDSPTAP